MVKMKKPEKKKALTTNWEGPYLFVAHTDRIGNLDFEEGSRICIIQDVDGNQWERPRRDLQVYHTPQSQKSGGTQLFEERRGDICDRLWGGRMET